MVNGKKILSLILRAPMALLVFAALGAGVYLAYTKQMEISWTTPIIILVLIAMYIIGSTMNVEEAK